VREGKKLEGEAVIRRCLVFVDKKMCFCTTCRYVVLAWQLVVKLGSRLLWLPIVPTPVGQQTLVPLLY
jgi:hypothetical protein